VQPAAVTEIENVLARVVVRGILTLSKQQATHQVPMMGQGRTAVASPHRMKAFEPPDELPLAQVNPQLALYREVRESPADGPVLVTEATLGPEGVIFFVTTIPPFRLPNPCQVPAPDRRN
jgi:hypothetical protein